MRPPSRFGIPQPPGAFPVHVRTTGSAADALLHQPVPRSVPHQSRRMDPERRSVDRQCYIRVTAILDHNQRAHRHEQMQ